MSELSILSEVTNSIPFSEGQIRPKDRVPGFGMRPAAALFQALGFEWFPVDIPMPANPV
jgi:hypothetical protein